MRNELPNIEYFQNFCDFFENGEVDNSELSLKLLLVHLLNIYKRGLELLPNFNSSDKEYPLKFINEKFENRLNLIAEKFGDSKYYWDTFDPSDLNDKKPVCGDLVEDIGDIYKDIKKSLMIFSIDDKEAKDMAMWNFEFQFNTHWGDHCIDAIRACHYFLRKKLNV